MKWLSVFICLLSINSLMAQKYALTNLTSAEIKDSSIAYQRMANWYRDQSHYSLDSSRIYFSHALRFLKQSGVSNKQRLIEVITDMINFNSRTYAPSVTDSLAKTAQLYLEEIPVAKRLPSTEVDLYCEWSSITIERGDNKKALEFITKAIQANVSKDDAGLNANLALAKGLYYARGGRKEDFEIGRKELLGSLAYYKTLNKSESANQLAAVYKVIIFNFDIVENIDSNFYYLQQLKEILPECKNPLFRAWYNASFARDVITFPNFASDTVAKLGKSRLEIGENAVLESLDILERCKVYHASIYPYCIGLLGDIARQQKKYDLAIHYYLQCRDRELGINFLGNSIGMLQLLSETYQQKGDLDSALYYSRKFAVDREEYLKQQSQLGLQETELKFDVLKKEKEIAQKDSQRNLLFALVVTAASLLVLLGIILFGLNRNYKSKQKLNAKLEALNLDLELKNSLLDKRNAENELLLKEIHHRVKNNLEIVSGLLALQAAEIDNPSALAVMQASQNRVASMGIIHQKLYQKGNLAAIEMRDYFHNLGENILDAFNASDKVTVKTDMPVIELDVDTAVPIGLIANELLCNSLKYAFPGDRKGNIDIKLLKGVQPGDIIFTLTDDGIGKADNAVSKGTGFGTELVNLLVQQLDGKMHVDNTQGTRIEIQFNYSKAI